VTAISIYLSYHNITRFSKHLKGQNMIKKAKAFACEAHSEQRRKGPLDLPYSVHLEEVAEFVSRHAGDEVAIAAAWLHDTVEDVGITFEELETEFGIEVANVVRELTDDKALPKAERKRLQIENAPYKSTRAVLVKLGDKTSNVRAIALTPPDWPDERKAEYRNWASAVVSALPFASKTALSEFEEALKLR
jgi:(p)ppGpp synthase/HD superfamily hydrolase